MKLKEEEKWMEISILKKNLERLNIKVSVFDTKEQASDYLCSKIDGETVGIGGSMTVKEMGLYERLCEKNDVAWHLVDESRAPELIAKAAAAKTYITGANAIAEEGAIVNLDGFGNRVASTLFGHEKVYIISGINKLVPTLQEAIERVRNVASPLNARRLKKKTPCAKGELKCYNCASEDRICSGFSIIIAKPGSIGYMELVLVRQELGF